MLERYTRERQRGQGKKGLFNLEEGDDLDDLEEGNVLGGLTHGGRSVMDLPGDDFMLQGLDDEDDPEEKTIDRRTVQKTHFGGFQEPEEEEEVRRFCDDPCLS
jgi:nucleolar protein 14